MVVGSVMSRFKIGEYFILEQDNRKLLKDNEEVNLPELSYRLLVCLVEHAPQIASHQTLLEQVWQGKVVSEDTVKKRVSRLREVLAAQPEQAVIISERGLGYRLNLPISKITPCTEQPPVANNRLNIKAKLAITAVVVFALSAFITVGVKVVEGFANKDALAVAESSEITQFMGLYQAQDITKALSTLTDLEAKTPHDLSVLAVLSENYLMQYRLNGANLDDLERAIKYAQLGIKHHPGQPWGYVVLAHALIESGKVTQALAESQKAIDLAQNWVEGYVAQATGYRLMGDVDSAWRSISKAHNLQPDHPNVKLTRAQVLTAKNMFSWSEQALNELAVEQPVNLFVQLALAELEMTTAAYAQAQNRLQDLVQEFPDAYKANMLLALVYDLQKKPEDALIYYKAVSQTNTLEGKLALRIMPLMGQVPASIEMAPKYEQAVSLLFSPLAVLHTGGADGFVEELNASIEAGFATEYLLKLSSIDRALNTDGAASEAVTQFKTLQTQLYHLNQAKRVKRKPVLKQ